jgi:predicted phosphate transport protein (TIGR00153 family)
VRFRIRPVETSFYDLFSEMANHLVNGANLLAQMLDAGADKSAIGEQMREAEHQADETTHAIIRRANSTFITPFDREDIYRLASSLDDVMDFMEETVDLVSLYELGDLPSDFAPQVEVLQRATQLTAEAMPRLRTMKDLDEYWIEINRLENQGDRSYRRIVAHLFSGSYKSLEVMKLKDVVDSLEHAIDALESVANTVEQIAVKES